MVTIKGLDVGYHYTKDNSNMIFKSAVSTVDRDLLGSIPINIDNVNYYVGNGEMTSEADKTQSIINKVCTIANLVKTGSEDVYLTVGLPISQYDKQKSKLRDTILDYQQSSIYHQGKQFKFRLHDVVVAPQGASAIYTMKNPSGKFIIIDVGGITIDVSLITIDTLGVHIDKCDTYYKGMRYLYSEVIASINNKYSLKLDQADAENILLNGLSYRGEKQDLKFIDTVIQSYLDEIIEEIKIKYPTETAPIYLCGGGSVSLYKTFNNRFFEINMIENPQYANALGYFKIGYLKFAQRGGVYGCKIS